MTIYDRTHEAALLRKRRTWNPLPHLWTAWQIFSYFWCPPGNDPCVYCWTLRLFIVGGVIGFFIGRWFPWR